MSCQIVFDFPVNKFVSKEKFTVWMMRSADGVVCAEKFCLRNSFVEEGRLPRKLSRLEKHSSKKLVCPKEVVRPEKGKYLIKSIAGTVCRQKVAVFEKFYFP